MHACVFTGWRAFMCVHVYSCVQMCVWCTCVCAHRFVHVRVHLRLHVCICSPYTTCGNLSCTSVFFSHHCCLLYCSYVIRNDFEAPRTLDCSFKESVCQGEQTDDARERLFEHSSQQSGTADGTRAAVLGAASCLPALDGRGPRCLETSVKGSGNKRCSGLL